MHLNDLNNAYDGAVPTDLLNTARYGGYTMWQKRLARAAECNFHALVLSTLTVLAAWRVRKNSFLVRRQLKNHSKLLVLYRGKACEAFDLSA